jgi:hypothetical protein
MGGRCVGVLAHSSYITPSDTTQRARDLREIDAMMSVHSTLPKVVRSRHDIAATIVAEEFYRDILTVVPTVHY